MTAANTKPPHPGERTPATTVKVERRSRTAKQV
jgi:hypothetical protein